MRARHWSSLFILAIITTTPAKAEVIHGTASIEDLSNIHGEFGTGFDFATRQSFAYPPETGDLDIRAEASFENGSPADSYVLALNAATMIEIVGTSFEDLVAAPVGPYPRTTIEPAEGRVFVMLTGDGLYVKFVFHGIQNPGGAIGMEIDYYVQTDGTPNFGPVLAVEPTTWGKIKSLYR